MKQIVLDTSVIAYDNNCLSTFQDVTIILPITVIEELDRLKAQSNEVGRNARVFIRMLDNLLSTGNVADGIQLDNGNTLKIDTNPYDAIGSDKAYGDNHILACAINNHTKENGTILMSRDINLRIRAQAFGIKAEGYNSKNDDTTDILYSGNRSIINKNAGKKLMELGHIFGSDYGLSDMAPNECIVFTDKNGTGIASGKKVNDEIRLIQNINPWGLQLRGKEQLFAAELIMDANIPLVSLIGRSGCGKTLLACAAALELVLNQKKYDSFLIYRPMQAVGEELGFLPGDASEKLEPWFIPIDDAFALLFSDRSKKKDGWKKQLHQYIDNGTIQKEALTYIRGRSIPNSLILLDECQNLSKDEVKAILTRISEGSKIVITGDIQQIDNRSLDPINNGLSYIIEKFKNSPLAGHITLTKGERSPLATEAARIL